MSAKTIREGIILEPQSSDPAAVEGQLQFADGAVRAKGLWQFKNGQWSSAGGAGGSGSGLRLLSLGAVTTEAPLSAGAAEVPFDTGFGIATAFDEVNAQNTLGHDMQSFTPISSGDLNSITIELAKASSDNVAPGADVVVHVHPDTGGNAPDTATILAISSPVLAPQVDTSSQPSACTFSGVSLVGGTRYWFSIHANSIAFNSSTNRIRHKRFSTSEVAGESRYSHDGTSYQPIIGTVAAKIDMTAAGSPSSDIDIILDKEVFIQAPGREDDRNRLAPQTITLPNSNSAAYVTLNLDSDVATDLMVTVVDIESVPSGATVIARRYEDKVYFGDNFVLGKNDSKKIDQRGPRVAPNLVRNATFLVKQRGSSFSGLSGLNNYTADGWQAGGQVGTAEFDGSGASEKGVARLIKAGTSNSINTLLHKLGPDELADLEAGDTLSIKFKANKEQAGILAVGHVQILRAVGAGDFSSTSSVFTYNAPSQLETSTAGGDFTTVYTSYEVTAQDLTNGLMIRIGASSDNNANIYNVNIKEPHIYKGDNSEVKFQTKSSSTGAELVDCQRYFRIIDNMKGQGLASNVIFLGEQFTVAMRATPTISTFDLTNQSVGGGMNTQIPGVYNQTPGSFTTGGTVIIDNKGIYINVAGYTGITTGSIYNVALRQNNGVVLSASAEY